MEEVKGNREKPNLIFQKKIKSYTKTHPRVSHGYSYTTSFRILPFFLPSSPLSFLVSLFLSLSHNLCIHPKFSGAHTCFVADSVRPPCEFRGVCGPWCGQGPPAPSP